MKILNTFDMGNFDLVCVDKLDRVTRGRLREAAESGESVFPMFEDEFGVALVDDFRPEIYVNDRATVLKAGGETFIAKAEKGERVDIEKGILVCLAKYCGFTTTDVHNMVEMAQVQPTKRKKKKASLKK